MRDWKCNGPLCLRFCIRHSSLSLQLTLFFFPPFSLLAFSYPMLSNWSKQFTSCHGLKIFQVHSCVLSIQASLLNMLNRHYRITNIVFYIRIFCNANSSHNLERSIRPTGRFEYEKTKRFISDYLFDLILKNGSHSREIVMATNLLYSITHNIYWIENNEIALSFLFAGQ